MGELHTPLSDWLHAAVRPYNMGDYGYAVGTGHSWSQGGAVSAVLVGKRGFRGPRTSVMPVTPVWAFKPS